MSATAQEYDWWPNIWTDQTDHEPTNRLPLVEVPGAVITGELPIWNEQEWFYQELQRARLEAEEQPSRLRAAVEFLVAAVAGGSAAIVITALIGLAILAGQLEEEPAEEELIETPPPTATGMGVHLGQFLKAEVVAQPTTTSAAPVTATERTVSKPKRSTVISAAPVATTTTERQTTTTQPATTTSTTTGTITAPTTVDPTTTVASTSTTELPATTSTTAVESDTTVSSSTTVIA